jgi:DNA-binding NarL/FixJ family response regulator
MKSISPAYSPLSSALIPSVYRKDYSMKTRIYVVDDHALFRKGVSVIISAESDMEVCGEGEDCVHATQDILKLKPDVVVVDISLKGNSGIELIKNVRAVDPQIQFVVLSMHDETVYALRVLRVGAKAYVMKQDVLSAVVEAIQRVRKGQLYVSGRVASQMLNRYAQGERLEDDSPVAGLSDRELEVVNLIGSGISTRDIASRLNVSIKTIETHRAHIKNKLNLSSAAQLVQFCVRWVDQSEHVRLDLGDVVAEDESEPARNAGKASAPETITPPSGGASSSRFPTAKAGKVSLTK